MIEEVTIDGRRTPAVVSERAGRALAGTRFSPNDLLRAHEDPSNAHALESIIGSQRFWSDGALVSTFCLAGDLVVWTVTSPSAGKTVVLLPSEVPQHTELFH